MRADLVQSPGPIAYLPVEDLEATLNEIERAGGRVLVRSLPFAGGGEVGLFADPDGNVLGLWKRKEGGAAAAAAKPATKPSTAAKPAAAAKRPPSRPGQEARQEEVASEPAAEA